MLVAKTEPKEGELYGVFVAGGHTIEVRYGYMDERDRKSERIPGQNMIPVTPDFLKEPLYDEKGYPLVTDIQDSCKYYEPNNPEEPEDWCRDCNYFPADKPKIGVCECKKRIKMEESR